MDDDVDLAAFLLMVGNFKAADGDREDFFDFFDFFLFFMEEVVNSGRRELCTANAMAGEITGNMVVTVDCLRK